MGAGVFNKLIIKAIGRIIFFNKYGIVCYMSLLAKARQSRSLQGGYTLAKRLPHRYRSSQ